MNFGNHVIALTGASGFVGNKLFSSLNSLGIHIKTFGRNSVVAKSNVELDLIQTFDVRNDLESIDCFIHCAGLAHIANTDKEESLEGYLRFNTAATIELATQAADAGVKRFIYLSSVKALGESTSGRAPFGFDSKYSPVDHYGISKALAEKELRELAEKRGMEVVIIRPPLVYGANVKANFLAMMRLAERNLPLPLGSVRNKRSIVALDNLVDLIVTCISHPAAGNQIFMVSDGIDVSTPELLSAMTRAHDKSPRLFPFPPSLLVGLARIFGKGAVADRLFDSLQVDIEHTVKTLGWAPSVKLEDVLKEMVRDKNV